MARTQFQAVTKQQVAARKKTAAQRRRELQGIPVSQLRAILNTYKLQQIVLSRNLAQGVISLATFKTRNTKLNQKINDVEIVLRQRQTEQVPRGGLGLFGGNFGATRFYTKRR
jgi:hypothetical protein